MTTAYFEATDLAAWRLASEIAGDLVNTVGYRQARYAEGLPTQGKYAEALVLREQVLAIREATLGANHPDVAHSLDSLAYLSHTNGDAERAAALVERAVEIREHELGAEHPEYAASLANLGNVRQAMGDVAGARVLQTRVRRSSSGRWGRSIPTWRCCWSPSATRCISWGTTTRRCGCSSGRW